METKINTDSETLNLAKEILAESLHLEIDDIENDASISTLAQWDSLGHMRIILGLEERLGIELPAELVVEIARLGDVADVLESQRE